MEIITFYLVFTFTFPTIKVLMCVQAGTLVMAKTIRNTFSFFFNLFHVYETLI